MNDDPQNLSINSKLPTSDIKPGSVVFNLHDVESDGQKDTIPPEKPPPVKKESEIKTTPSQKDLDLSTLIQYYISHPSFDDLNLAAGLRQVPPDLTEDEISNFIQACIEPRLIDQARRAADLRQKTGLTTEEADNLVDSCLRLNLYNEAIAAAKLGASDAKANEVVAYCIHHGWLHGAYEAAKLRKDQPELSENEIAEILKSIENNNPT